MLTQALHFQASAHHLQSQAQTRCRIEGSGKRRYINKTIHGTKKNAQACLTGALRDQYSNRPDETLAVESKFGNPIRNQRTTESENLITLGSVGSSKVWRPMEGKNTEKNELPSPLLAKT